MAAGLGTRMRSAVPKHLHPVLGRRMVDWVIAAARELGADPVVVVASPSAKDSFDGSGVEVAVQERAARHRRRGPLSARRARGSRRGRPGPDRRHAGAHLRSPARARRDAPPRGRRGDRAHLRPADSRAYGRIVRDADGHVRAIVEARDASPEELELGEVNCVDLRRPRREALARARAARAAERPGRALPHRRRTPSSSRTARPSPRTSPPIRSRSRA